MTIVSLTLKIGIYRSIGSPGQVKYVVDGLNTRYKSHLRGKINIISNNITTTCDGLGMLHYVVGTQKPEIPGRPRRAILLRAMGFSCLTAVTGAVRKSERL